MTGWGRHCFRSVEKGCGGGPTEAHGEGCGDDRGDGPIGGTQRGVGMIVGAGQQEAHRLF